jgi:hypothetical protein
MAARKRLLERHGTHPLVSGVSGVYVRLALISVIQLQAALRGYAARCSATKRRAERKKQLEAEERKRRKAEKAEASGGLKSRRGTIEARTAGGKAQPPVPPKPPPKSKSQLKPSPPRAASESGRKALFAPTPTEEPSDGLLAQACTAVGHIWCWPRHAHAHLCVQVGEQIAAQTTPTPCEPATEPQSEELPAISEQTSCQVWHKAAYTRCSFSSIAAALLAPLRRSGRQRHRTTYAIPADRIAAGKGQATDASTDTATSLPQS